MPNDSFAAVREFAPILLILGAVVWTGWSGRRRIRPWHLWLTLGAVLISVPMTIALLVSARSGSWSGWGGLGLVVLLLPAGMVAALSVTALIMMAILLPRFGFDPRTHDQRRAARVAARTPEARRDHAIFRLKFSLVGLIITLSIIGVRRLLD